MTDPSRSAEAAVPGDAAWVDEVQEWLDALDAVLRERGDAAAAELLRRLQQHGSRVGLVLPEASLNTPYVNTIPLSAQPRYPGDLALEQRLENLIRWNAAAMVMQAYDSGSGVGGHIATYLSAATLLEVGFNHFFRGRAAPGGGDQVHVQAHAAPGIYARAFLEGRLSDRQLGNFRRELAAGGGLPSYPHPRRMPGFWSLPTASMGLSTPSAIYQARFAKYLERRGLKPADGGRVWCFIGDGESDEPEVLGTINMASREGLDNLVLVINCNLQRLDGPVRGNGKIIQELERSFRGADWHVIKVIWGSGWDPLLERDRQGLLRQRMEEAVDGDYQMYSAQPGELQREHWVEDIPELKALMDSLTDEEIRTIKRGGQDAKKIHAAYAEACSSVGKPVVILCKTVKGDGLGPAAQGRNTVHQKKNLTPDERVQLARRLGIPIDEAAARRAAFHLPPEDAEERSYLRARRETLGGPLPERDVRCRSLEAPPLDYFADQLKGSGERQVSTTMALVRMLARLLRHPELGRFVVPIVPDEARTFGMDGLFAQAGIYSPAGQVYQPVDADSIAPYREAEDGQILQEGICETGAMASFLAAGTAYANHGVPTIPFYIFYSIFGFQRVGDMIWACGDSMARGFLLGGTSGRTTLNGEGLQHQDGHSQLVAGTVPNLRAYDPAFAFELAIILRDGIDRMYGRGEDAFYYITVTNQNQLMPALPEGADGSRDRIVEGVVRGMYLFRRSSAAGPRQAHLFGSGAIMQEVLDAAERLEAQGVPTSIWSVTSYGELLRDGRAVERQRRLHPERSPPQPYLEALLGGEEGVFVSASDYVAALGEGLSRWVPGPYAVLGTDGYGLSEARPVLRDHFEVSGAWIAHAALSLLERAGQIPPGTSSQAAAGWGMDLEKVDAVSW
ncbi:MAG: pyruvate dehydrogenase (acetyl-transferring), homodimeric type [Pseudomonadales bacterium]|jgi:pyruvate dehydrogenase E1 component|nr:pyruvate dehydrogenase (acetyl-transferring), homodimeric type [Pseudomonadales bacterium]